MRDRFYAAVSEYESILDVIAYYERGERHGIVQALRQRFEPILELVADFTERYHQTKRWMQQEGVTPRGG